MNRRDFIVSSLAAIPIWCWSSKALAAMAGAKPRVLILVELAGGNDGLRTVIPHADPEYRRLRPTLGIERDRVLTLSDRVGLHPGLSPLMESWGAGDLAVVQGVGYDRPNRSHFRSIEIWETASDADEFVTDGWLARGVAALPDGDEPTSSIIMGDRDEGPMAGGAHRPIVMDDPGRFFEQIRALRAPTGAGDNDALRHIMNVQGELSRASSTFERFVTAQSTNKGQFEKSSFGRQLDTTVRVLSSDIPVRAVKVTLDGFDTHARQQPVHDRLMAEFASGLTTLRKALIASGDWNRVMIMTYSEFGRRAAENGSYGTDHGTAAPHFVAGGRVMGGLYGDMGRLDDLTDGDVRFAIDFRSLYATALRRWWGVPADHLGAHSPVECVRA